MVFLGHGVILILYLKVFSRDSVTLDQVESPKLDVEIVFPTGFIGL